MFDINVVHRYHASPSLLARLVDLVPQPFLEDPSVTLIIEKINIKGFKGHLCNDDKLIKLIMINISASDMCKVFHLLTNFSQRSHWPRWPGRSLNGTKQVLQTFLISIHQI